MTRYRLALLFACVASMATSQMPVEVESPLLEPPDIKLTPEASSTAQHFRLLANASAGVFAAERAQLSVGADLYGTKVASDDCDNYVVVRIIPDHPDLAVVENRLQVAIDTSDDILFPTLWGQPFLSCAGTDACEDGATVEFEWEESDCENFSSVVIDWNVRLKMRDYDDVPSDATLDVQFD